MDFDPDVDRIWPPLPPGLLAPSPFAWLKPRVMFHTNQAANAEADRPSLAKGSGHFVLRRKF